MSRALIQLLFVGAAACAKVERVPEYDGIIQRRSAEGDSIVATLPPEEQINVYLYGQWAFHPPRTGLRDPLLRSGRAIATRA